MFMSSLLARWLAIRVVLRLPLWAGGMYQPRFLSSMVRPSSPSALHSYPRGLTFIGVVVTLAASALFLLFGVVYLYEAFFALEPVMP